jgi:hypothetical protein
MGDNWTNWAQRLSAYLTQTRSILRHKVAGESAKDNGIILWDGATNLPVVSIDGVYAGLVTANGFTVATLPIGVVGQRSYVTDANGPTFGAAVSGGGAVVIPVFKNATTWIVG